MDVSAGVQVVDVDPANKAVGIDDEGCTERHPVDPVRIPSSPLSFLGWSESIGSFCHTEIMSKLSKLWVIEVITEAYRLFVTTDLFDLVRGSRNLNGFSFVTTLDQ